MAQTAHMGNSADCYAMTGGLQAAGTVPGEPRIAVGLTAGLLPLWMLHRVSGKEITHLRVARAGEHPVAYVERRIDEAMSAICREPMGIGYTPCIFLRVLQRYFEDQ